MSAQKLTSSQLNLPHGTKQKRVMKKPKTKNGDAQKKNGPVIKSVDSVLRPEKSMVGKICERALSRERKREEVMDGETGELTVIKCGRSMNRQVRDRVAGMTLTERTRKLIPERRLNRDEVVKRIKQNDTTAPCVPVRCKPVSLQR